MIFDAAALSRLFLARQCAMGNEEFQVSQLMWCNSCRCSIPPRARLLCPERLVVSSTDLSDQRSDERPLISTVQLLGENGIISEFVFADRSAPKLSSSSRSVEKRLRVSSQLSGEEEEEPESVAAAPPNSSENLVLAEHQGYCFPRIPHDSLLWTVMGTVNDVS